MSNYTRRNKKQQNKSKLYYIHSSTYKTHYNRQIVDWMVDTRYLVTIKAKQNILQTQIINQLTHKQVMW